MEREVRYATAEDGVAIAYWTMGQGEPLVQLPALPYSHIGAEWDIPRLRRSHELLSAQRTLVRYDGRGVGLSQRDVSHFSLETMVADLDAVIDALELERVTLLGVINTGAAAIAYAARRPERVSRLMLWCPVVDGAVHVRNPQLEAVRKVLDTDWDLYTMTVAHALLGWGEGGDAQQFAEFIRKAVSQEAARRLIQAIHELNVWDQLPAVRCPTLVMHRPALPLFPPGMMESVCAAIPDSRLMLFEGNSAVPYLGDWQTVYHAMYDFMGIRTAARSRSGASRALRLLNMKSDSLTPREREIVALVVQGMTNAQIAEKLYLSEKTVENHVSRILAKLDLTSRARLAAYAVEHGLVSKSA
jgi:DNA-binding CsgD family transcriptional regulator/pimeloyl-ACP methyl ester carboxylesterase